MGINFNFLYYPNCVKNVSIGNFNFEILLCPRGFRGLATTNIGLERGLGLVYWAKRDKRRVLDRELGLRGSELEGFGKG